MRLTAVLAAALMMGSAAVSAHATTYTFEAGQDTGTFTTGAISPVDSGYYLLTDFFFATADAGSAVYTNEDATAFQANAAFDPLNQSFVNHANSSTFANSGSFGNDDIVVFGVTVGSSVSIKDVNGFGLGQSSAPFEITAGLPVTPPPVSAAPEPSTWLLMMAGVAMLGGMLRWNKRERGSIAGAAAL